MSGEPSLEIAGAAQRVGSADLLGWLGEKIAAAEKAVKAREQAAATWRDGTNADWEAACAMHPTTAGRALKKRERMAAAAREDRIAAMCRRELQMFKATAKALSQPNTQ